MGTTIPVPTPTLEQVAALADRRSVEIEQHRRLPDDLVAALVATGVFKRWVPTVHGGAQGHVHDLLDAIETVAHGDGSTGWCVMIGGTTSLCSGFLPPADAAEIFGPPDAVTGGYGMPAGTAVAVDGGLRVRGRWSWGSGTTHCTRIGGGVRIVDVDGTPAPLADGTVAPFVFFEPGDVVVHDTWHTVGLRGTGSSDYEVVDAFVPTGRWVDFAGGAEPVVDHPLYRFSFLGALAAGVASVLVGLARRALDEVVAIGDRVPAGSSRALAERPAVQARIASADAAVRSARAFLRATVDECWDVAATGAELTGEHRRLLRLAATDASARCAAAVDTCYRAAGGAAIHEAGALQRVFRDTHVATQHGMVAERTLEPLGRMVFGLPTDIRQL